jgi:hypothetical protein
MKTTITFGKIAYNNPKRKSNELTIQLELKQKECVNHITNEKETMWIFTASANIWNNIKSDIIAGGQMIDETLKYCKNPLLKEIHDIWVQYHLNDLKAGLKTQCDAVDTYFKSNDLKYDYTKACEYLKEIGLFEVDSVKYGHGWYCMPIPENIVNRIKIIIESNSIIRC